ncbi:MAG TPA: hypothetical protein EYO18_08530, partial [Candidatus Marinimicrobia bacterium]|nr:hypothetical protein [Candidatus Neomarinimicrobiota bacterium]
MVKGYVPPAPVITIISPVNGQVFNTGDEMEIQWDLQNVVNTYNLSYSTDGGINWNDIAVLNDAEASEYIWSVPNFYSTNTLIKVLGNGPGGVVGSEIVGPLAVIPGSLDDLLSDGWNLISLPLDPLDGSTFADVFLTALPSPHYIYNLSESGQYGIVDDSMSVTTASGYWIALFENASITLEAENQILTESILLNSGWNL